MGVALGCVFVSAVVIGAAIFWIRRKGSSAGAGTDGNDILRNN